jgi:hypothetical protein
MKSIISLLSSFSLCAAVLLLVYCGPGPTGAKQTITITSPAAGAEILAGDTISVQWTQPVANPALFYNYNLTSSVWQSFATVIPVSSREVKVVLPTTWFSDSFQVKVEDNAGVYDAGISGYLHLKYIILTTALTGITVKVGDSITLSWRALKTTIPSVEVMLSTDTGLTFNEIIGTGSIPTGTALSCIWVVGSETGWNFLPQYPSPTCVVKVRKYSDDPYKDVSGIFTVAKP